MRYGRKKTIRSYVIFAEKNAMENATKKLIDILNGNLEHYEENWEKNLANC